MPSAPHIFSFEEQTIMVLPWHDPIVDAVGFEALGLTSGYGPSTPARDCAGCQPDIRPRK